MDGAAQLGAEQVNRRGERENDDDRDRQQQCGTSWHEQQGSEERLNGP